QILVGGQELMQWWIDQANNDRVAFARLGIDHRLEETFEVTALEGQQLIEGSLALLFRLCQDHPLHNGQALLLHEHMLCTAEADTLATESNCTFGITWIVSIGPDPEFAELVSPVEQLLEVCLFLKVGINRLDDACEDFTCGTVDRNLITFFDYDIRTNDAEEMLCLADANPF